MPCGGAREQRLVRAEAGGGFPAARWSLGSEVVSPHLAVVVFLPLVREHGADDHSRVFNDHFPGFDGSLAEQTATVNG